MLVSTKGRHTLYTMVNLAVHGDGEPVKIRDIVNRQGTSGKYLEQIISILSRAGYMCSIRGNQDGHYLSKPAAEYTVDMILRVTEESLVSVGCLSGGDNSCTRQLDYATLRLWRELSEAIKGMVDQYTLGDLVQWRKNIKDNYVI